MFTEENTDKTYLIEGGRSLHGRVEICGAKNSVLKIMAAGILADESLIIKNVPDITDVHLMAEVLRRIGLSVRFTKDHELLIEPADSICLETPYELVSKMRASFIVLGPLVARYGRAKVAMPGGCQIGTRKIDLHLKGLESLGVQIEIGDGYVEASCDRLIGSHVHLDFPSVGATENIAMAAVLADGESIIENAAREPEIVDLLECLKKMGADISGIGTSVVKIQGVSRLSGAEHNVIGDRIEAATYLLAGAITGGSIETIGVEPDHLKTFISKLERCGLEIEQKERSIALSSGPKLLGVDVATLPHPGFPTDLQAPMMAFLALCQGESTITENIFENRFMFIHELRRMGAQIMARNHFAHISGVTALQCESVKATDLRGGAALVLAALAASGTSSITDIYHVERGYGNMIEKLTMLGANITIPQRSPA